MRIGIEADTKGRQMVGIDYICLEKDGREFCISCNGESSLSDNSVYWKGVDILYSDEDGEADANGRIDEMIGATVVGMQAYDYKTDEELVDVLPIKGLYVDDYDNTYVFPENSFEKYNAEVA